MKPKGKSQLERDLVIMVAIANPTPRKNSLQMCSDLPAECEEAPSC